MNDLTDKVAIVTGAGRERGIGRTTALELARRGAHVVVADLARPGVRVAGLATVAEDTDVLEATAAEIRSMGRRALAISVDVNSDDEVRACVETTLEAFGRIDILFNNAGTPIGAQPFELLDESTWELSWQVNVMGAVRFCRHIAPVMCEVRRGAIVNNASLAALRPAPHFSAYTATKFALLGFTQSLALDLGPFDVRVNAVCPGDIATQMTDLGVDLGDAGAGELSANEQIALRRRGTPDDVARVVAWLASDDAGYVTGEALRVDGGWMSGL